MTAQATTPDQTVFVGIDFGTTKTMVASYDASKKSAKPLTFGRGKFEKPTSMYATATGDLLFGDDADDEGITDLPNHIRRFKMKLGKPGLAHMGRKSGTAQQLTTEFLGSLRNQLENQVLHTSVDRVILTVPAMFGPAQRHDLTEAARQAGFSQVELLEEPVAAGIAYCDHQSDLSKELRFIVVDWGGGTFDVAHLEKSAGGEIKVHEDFVVGLDDIGGEAFDDELWGIASSALDSAGRGTLDSQSREHWGRYRRDLSRAKETLSSQTAVSMTFTLADGSPAKVTLNRADFNNIISPMIQKAASFVSQLITRARDAGCPPEFILLAGGTSRIPLIGEELERITGVKCRQWSDGREAIALGAAIRANQLWGQQPASKAQEVWDIGNGKVALMAQYRSLLEAAWLDGRISKEEKNFLNEKSVEFGLTDQETDTIQIELLGSRINDFPQLNQEANKPVVQNLADPQIIPTDTIDIIKKATNGFATDDFFIQPHIPDKKVKGVIGSYAPHVRPADVLLLHDTTVFGSAKTGFILTKESICWRNNSEAKMLKYADIKNISALDSKGFFENPKLKVNTDEIDIVSSTADKKNMILKISAETLRAIIDRHQ